MPAIGSSNPRLTCRARIAARRVLMVDSDRGTLVALCTTVQEELLFTCAVSFVDDSGWIEVASSAEKLPPPELVVVGLLRGLGHSRQYDSCFFVLEFFASLQG